MTEEIKQPPTPSFPPMVESHPEDIIGAYYDALLAFSVTDKQRSFFVYQRDKQLFQHRLLEHEAAKWILFRNYVEQGKTVQEALEAMNIYALEPVFNPALAHITKTPEFKDQMIRALFQNLMTQPPRPLPFTLVPNNNDHESRAPETQTSETFSAEPTD